MLAGSLRSGDLHIFSLHICLSLMILEVGRLDFLPCTGPPMHGRKSTPQQAVVASLGTDFNMWCLLLQHDGLATPFETFFHC